MINNSPAEYAFIRLSILCLQAIPVISIFYTIYELLFYPTSRHLPLIFRLFFAAEALFFLFFFIPFRAYLQRDAVHPPLGSGDDRRELFRRIVAHTKSHELEGQLRLWFKGASFEQIGKGGVKSWLDWALFEGRAYYAHEQELDEYASELEDILGTRFAPGSGSAVPLRLTLDPIRMCHRTLLWYFIVAIVDLYTYLSLCWTGYTFYRQSMRRFFTLFPLRPIALTARQKSPSSHLTYWYRPHTSKTRHPIVFIHGIGIGLYPYISFLSDLASSSTLSSPDSEDGQVGILALELLPISFRLTTPMPSKSALLAEISVILAYHNITSFVLATHSYGSVIATHLLSRPEICSRIPALLLIDPVTLLLHTPSVAYNFTVRPPRRANEWQLWYFASQDPGVAHTLGRHFHWAQNTLWLRESLMPLSKKVTVSLAARDLIVDTQSVGQHLAEETQLSGDDVEGDGWKHRPWSGQGLEILWFDGTDHAQVFDVAWKRAELSVVLREYCKST